MSKSSNAIPAKLVICHGKACRKRKKAHKKLRLLLPKAKKGKCMGVCKGPVLYAKCGKKRLLFYKLRKKKARKHLERFVQTGKRSKKIKTRTL